VTAPGDIAKDILHQPAYRFCSQPSYPWTDSEAEWCAAVGDTNDRCEAMPRACKGEMGHALTRYRRGGGGEHEDREPFVLNLPHIGPIGSFLMWGMIAVMVAVLIRLILAKAFRGRKDEKASETRAPTPSPVAENKKTQVEIDVERLLDRARQAAAEGRFADGIADAYAALLRQLEGERLLRIDPWRTNGDYLRELARRPEVRAEVLPLVRRVEAVQFGREEPTRERFDVVLREVERLLSSSIARSAQRVGLAAAAVACLALVLGSCTEMRGAEEDSPSGTSAVVELLRRSGLEAKMRYRSLAKDIDADEVVLLPSAHLDETRAHALLVWVNEGGTLVIANHQRWDVPQFPDVRFSMRPGVPFRLLLGPAAPAESRVASVVVPGTSELVVKAETAARDNLLERDGSVYAARFEFGEGEIIALADGRLFTNASLAMADNAAFLVAMLKQHDNHRIELVGELTGGGAKSPLSSVERGKLAPVLLQLGLVLVLFFLYKGIAFGTLVDPPSIKRRSFAEHARALGLLYAKARAAGHARAVYGAYALERLREGMLFREQKGIGALAEAVAARSGQPLGKVTLTLVEASEARPSDSKEKGSPEDLDVVRRLSRLLAQIKGGTK
jgi:hypothetical protein